MLRHKNIDRIACLVLTFTLFLTCGFMGTAAAGWIAPNSQLGYETRLFDQSRVHTIDICMDDWESFLTTCTSETYASCTVMIDGERYGNVAIRGKGNTSLSSVAQYSNDRYSFKIEFDHYQSGKSYYGLDKLCLNNLIQDKTYLKDYIAYTLMNRMGVAAPLCSFVQIRVNGEDWGFYLAVEGIEDGFLKRNYGNRAGELYKPDSLSFGGGRGNGEKFDMNAFAEDLEKQWSGNGDNPSNAESADENLALGSTVPKGNDLPEMPDSDGNDNAPAIPDGDMPSMPDGADFPFEMPEGMNPSRDLPDDFSFEKGRNFGGGMGSADVKLQYIDDDPDSYANIFDNAKTDIDDQDKVRLIAALKNLSENTAIDDTVDVEQVIRYFVVHNFLCNDDSYTGQMVHNYYLYENQGQLSMIPWDYNLAFGGFSMDNMGGATDTVNTPIDSLVSSGNIADRPMAAWILANERYTQLYHEIYSAWIEDTFESGWFESEINRVIEMIDPYVQGDTNGFFTYEDFTTATKSLKTFCALRTESIRGQLNSSIPSTPETQRQNADTLVDASAISLSDMGEFGMGRGDHGESPYRNSSNRSPHFQGTKSVNRTGDQTTMASESAQNPDALPNESTPASSNTDSDAPVNDEDVAFPADSGSFNPSDDLDDLSNAATFQNANQASNIPSGSANSDENSDAPTAPMERPSMPEAMGGEFSPEGAGHNPFEDNDLQSATSSPRTYSLWLMGSVILLILAIVFAKRFPK